MKYQSNLRIIFSIKKKLNIDIEKTIEEKLFLSNSIDNKINRVSQDY